jgi:hypothetical protein
MCIDITYRSNVKSEVTSLMQEGALGSSDTHLLLTGYTDRGG